MASSINASTSGAGGVITTADNSGILNLQTAGTTAITVDTSQNVGIGVTPSAMSAGIKAIQIGTGSSDGFFYGLGGNDTEITTNAYYNSGYKYQTSSIPATRYFQSNGIHAWAYASSGTAGNAISFTEAMRIDPSGNLLVGCTTLPSSSATSGTGFGVYGAGGSILQNMAGSPEGVSYNYTTYSSGTVYPIVFRTNGVVRGYINYNGTIVSYVSTSDERLKTNIVDSSSALPIISKVQVRQFNWIENNSLEQFGFIAQELNNVYPTAISEGDDNKDGTVDTPWGVDPSKLVPMLVKAIQELNAKVDAQDATITALQAKVGA